MNPDETDQLLLAAYLDGELSPGETLDMERRLAIDPGLRQKLKALQSLSGSVRQILAETPIPPSLSEMVNKQLAGVEIFPRKRDRRLWSLIAASLVIGFLSGGLLVYELSRPWEKQGANDTVDAIFASHLRGLAATRPFDIAWSDGHTVKPWFNGRTAIAPDAPDLGEQGYPPMGGRVDIVDGQTVPTIVYQRRQHIISVTVVPRIADGWVEPDRREGVFVEHWNAGDLTYFAASDLNAKELGEFGVLFRAATGGAQ